MPSQPLHTLTTACRTRLKICGLTRESDVDAAVDAGADAIGFVLYPKSPRYVSLDRAAELARRLPPFVTPVLLFVNEDATKIKAALASVAGAIAQFHGDETPADCWQAWQLLNGLQHHRLRCIGGVMGQVGQMRLIVKPDPHQMVFCGSQNHASQRTGVAA